MINKEEFKVIFGQYFDAIRLYIYYRIADADAASDMAQDVFVTVWEKRERLEGGHVKALLYKIAQGYVVDLYRKNDTQADFRQWASLQSDSSPTPQEMIERDEAMDRYTECLNAMTDAQREVFLMSREESLPYAEIAARLDISVKAVEKRMSGALKIINEKMR